jgi:hypothetical protein
MRLRRGINDIGNCAVDVETESIVYTENKICSHYQVRGSVPLKWSAIDVDGLSNAAIDLSNAGTDQSKNALNLHLDNLVLRYGGDLSLLDLLPLDTPDQDSLGRIFEAKLLELSRSDCEYLHYDGAKILNGDSNIFDHIKSDIARPMEKQGFFAANLTTRMPRVIQIQSGVFRLNGFNCIDTTNIIQQQIGVEKMVQMIEFIHSSLTNVPCTTIRKLIPSASQRRELNELWTGNGDAISLQYIGTRAMQGISRSWWNPFRPITLKIARCYLSTFQYDKRQEGKNCNALFFFCINYSFLVILNSFGTYTWS